jgi:hypothetical protein
MMFMVTVVLLALCCWAFPTLMRHVVATGMGFAGGMFTWGVSAIACGSLVTLHWVGIFVLMGLVGANALAYAFR